MAGVVFVLFKPEQFWVHVVVVEAINVVSSHLSQLQEGWTMIKKKGCFEVRSTVQRIARSIICSWEAHLPSRLSLLTSL